MEVERKVRGKEGSAFVHSGAAQRGSKIHPQALDEKNIPTPNFSVQCPRQVFYSFRSGTCWCCWRGSVFWFDWDLCRSLCLQWNQDWGQRGQTLGTKRQHCETRKRSCLYVWRKIRSKVVNSFCPDVQGPWPMGSFHGSPEGASPLVSSWIRVEISVKTLYWIHKRRRVQRRQQLQNPDPSGCCWWCWCYSSVWTQGRLVMMDGW